MQTALERLQARQVPAIEKQEARCYRVHRKTSGGNQVRGKAETPGRLQTQGEAAERIKAAT